MFRNFDKVFKFTFKNQTSMGGYKKLTFTVALLLIIIPIAIFVLVEKFKDSDEDLKPCGAEKVYVVNEATPGMDYAVLNMLNVEGYTGITYENIDDVDTALQKVKDNGEKKSLILQFNVSDDSIDSRIILPEGSDLEKEDAENLDKYIDMNGRTIAVLASGVDVQELGALTVKTDYDLYETSGYDKGVSIYDDQNVADEQLSEDMKPVFNIVLTFLCIMVIYFVALFYGNGIMQNIVLEKSSKLMDTMLISVRPEAMVFGKMLGVLAAAVIQFFTWIISLVIGLVGGVKIVEYLKPDTDNMVITFFNNFDAMGLFKPVSIVIAIVALLVGIVFYSSIATICGAISSTKEEAASNQGLFIMVLIISFYMVLFGGLKGESVATWMYMLPCTGAMVLPAGVCSGSLSIALAAVGLLIMIITTILLIILAGKLYTMMALYKGNKVNISKAMKMLMSSK